MAEISIIIPVYNAAKTLEACLQSIFSQTYQNFRIIVVDDGSTDESKHILNRHRRRLTIIKQPNRGAAVARNEGAKIAQSPLIIFCDADIVMKQNLLEKMRQALLIHPQASYAYSSFTFGKKVFKLWPFDAKRLKKKPYIHTTSLIRKEHFPGFDKTLTRFQDWDLWLSILEHGYTGIYIPEILFHIQPGGTMSTWLPKFIYYMPFLPAVKKYHRAKKIIKQKHNL